MFDLMYKEIAKPDLYIYLYQNTDRLIENIKKRGRDYEQNITPQYLTKIHQGYATFINTEKRLNSLIIDVSSKDFVNNPEDYKEIIDLIKKA
jgi:deoxyadenosine/deoxycytidine kinase